ncbi:hypothetical protein Fmac_018763 [Flemingia macrophylla]|uniref:Uncharacterized protein n=1 Tax=Flemingia macrophylla TaxID=520843 RepID=A0ABD1M5W9_9FABA
MVKGISGIGKGVDFCHYGDAFGGFSWQPPLLSLCHAVLTAVKEKHIRALLPFGPHCLGGDGGKTNILKSTGSSGPSARSIQTSVVQFATVKETFKRAERKCNWYI